MTAPRRIHLRQIERTDDVRSEFLKDRMRASGPTASTKSYVVLEGDEEVAWTSLEFRPCQEDLEIYEVYVLREKRSEGLGTAILREIEALGRREGYATVGCKPVPLDHGVDKNRLEQWYRDQGFEGCAEAPDWLRKSL